MKINKISMLHAIFFCVLTIHSSIAFGNLILICSHSKIPAQWKSAEKGDVIYWNSSSQNGKVGYVIKMDGPRPHHDQWRYVSFEELVIIHQKEQEMLATNGKERTCVTKLQQVSLQVPSVGEPLESKNDQSINELVRALFDQKPQMPTISPEKANSHLLRHFDYLDMLGNRVNARIKFNIKMNRIITEERSQIYENCNPNTLPTGKTYNFVITASGDLICGEIDNHWELGSRHNNLAQNRNVYGAGMMKIVEGSILFNLESGTYSYPICDKAKYEFNPYSTKEECEARLIKIFENIFSSLAPKKKIAFSPISFTMPLPTFKEVTKYCNHKGFRPDNEEFCSSFPTAISVKNREEGLARIAELPWDSTIFWKEVDTKSGVMFSKENNFGRFKKLDASNISELSHVPKQALIGELAELGVYLE